MSIRSFRTADLLLRGTLTAFFLAILLCIVGHVFDWQIAAAGTPKDPTKLTTAYLPITANLPLFVALSKGYFEERGVRVVPIEATSPNDIIAAMDAGKIDFAPALAYTIIFPAAIRTPGLFKLYCPTEETRDHYTSSIIVPRDSRITQYSDLTGKKIGVYAGLVQVNFLKSILIGMHINSDDIHIIEISPRLQIQGLISHAYDALSTTEPTSNIALAEGLARSLVENPRVKFIMDPFPSTAACVTTRLIRTNPKAAKAVVKALDAAIDFIDSHPQEAKLCLLKYTPIPRSVEARVLTSLKLFHYCKLGQEDRANIQKFADFLYDHKLLSKRINDVNLFFGDYRSPSK